MTSLPPEEEHYTTAGNNVMLAYFEQEERRFLSAGRTLSPFLILGLNSVLCEYQGSNFSYTERIYFSFEEDAVVQTKDQTWQQIGEQKNRRPQQQHNTQNNGVRWITNPAVVVVYGLILQDEVVHLVVVPLLLLLLPLIGLC